ncbi:hypothetical protein BJY52DRAFT_1215491 [Lactarius psammicola]|nr:hypothetical protein BJY52DRAFT_1215491 [Lactarius psammicola]
MRYYHLLSVLTVLAAAPLANQATPLQSHKFEGTVPANWESLGFPPAVACLCPSRVGNLLGASYWHYQHLDANETILCKVGYTLPAVLQAHVQTIAPTTHFAPPQMLQQTIHKRSREKTAEKANATSGELMKVLSSCGDDLEITSEYLRSLHKTSAYFPAAMN